MAIPELCACEVERLIVINNRRINHYLSMIASNWHCDKETAMKIYCEAYYLMKGYPPMTAAGTVECSWKRGIEYFTEVLFYPIVREIYGLEPIETPPKKVDLLNLPPTV